jgi:Flp pilus assembly protein TadG
MRYLLRRRGGQSMVEFAVLAPVFFLLLLGTIDLGRAVYIYNAISNAAREGARAAVPYDTPLPTNATTVAAVQSKLGGGFSLAADPCLSTPPCATPSTPSQPNTGYIWYSTGIGVITGSPHAVSVKITFLFQPWVPVVRDAAGNGVTMSAQTTMETEY